jgi:hypothetical protein
MDASLPALDARLTAPLFLKPERVQAPSTAVEVLA